MESASGGSENLYDSRYTEAKSFENISAFNGSVSAVSFLYFSILGKLDLLKAFYYLKSFLVTWLLLLVKIKSRVPVEAVLNLTL